MDNEALNNLMGTTIGVGVTMKVLDEMSLRRKRKNSNMFTMRY